MPYNILTGLIIFFILTNITGIIMMVSDKRRAGKGAWRISENTLLFAAFSGGALGMLIISKMIRHKTRKLKFKIGLPAIFVLQLIIFTALYILLD
ncbi:DUF1294 domain-containing protein [Salipaludibacillus sp. CUR1]|uniref:DUF1294 domain-containing protein n=1 Tax=Salipaludibacillus sp. CUR1 TaxID=2820003 RepID=UPI001E60BF67|nr:DUF1294 domain-containing protein [Salipaludibacillus sp. CUR1]MCE7793393.1 DUF1294 domain-containing protein [Salipaludibacillus sp. CUR1]